MVNLYDILLKEVVLKKSYKTLGGENMAEIKEETIKLSPMEILLRIRDRTVFWFHKKERFISDRPTTKSIEEMIQSDELLEASDSVRLPLSDEINHKDIMSFYVREYIEDKEIRQDLFYSLRRRDYFDEFISRLNKHGLYENFKDSMHNLYFQIWEEWVIENELESYFKK